MRKITKKRLEVKREIAVIIDALVARKDVRLIAAGDELKVVVR